MCNDPHHDHSKDNPNTKLANFLIGGAILAALLLGIAMVQQNQAIQKLRQEAKATQ